jgi:hypothetical protein
MSEEPYAAHVLDDARRIAFHQWNVSIDKNPTITSFLSRLVPGAGQLHCGSAKKSLFSLVAAIMIGNLNLSFILVFVLAKLDSSMG